MIWVVDKKVIKHVIEAGSALIEVPVRIRFEFSLAEERFVAGSMKRTFVYNRPAIVRRFPRLDPDRLDAEMEDVVDRTLCEHLKFAGYAQGDIDLYRGDEVDEVGAETVPSGEAEVPKIIMPDRAD